MSEQHSCNIPDDDVNSYTECSAEQQSMDEKTHPDGTPFANVTPSNVISRKLNMGSDQTSKKVRTKTCVHVVVVVLSNRRNIGVHIFCKQPGLGFFKNNNPIQYNRQQRTKENWRARPIVKLVIKNVYLNTETLSIILIFKSRGSSLLDKTFRWRTETLFVLCLTTVQVSATLYTFTRFFFIRKLGTGVQINFLK